MGSRKMKPNSYTAPPTAVGIHVLADSVLESTWCNRSQNLREGLASSFCKQMHSRPRTTSRWGPRGS